MAVKKDVKPVQKVEKLIRQKILVQEGGRMNSDVPCTTVYTEFVESAKAAKVRVEELRKEYPNCSICYFSV